MQVFFFCGPSPRGLAGLHVLIPFSVLNLWIRLFFIKLVVLLLESLSLKLPLPKRDFVNSSIFSGLSTQNLAILTQLYTSYIDFLSLRQDVVLETPFNAYKDDQAKLTLNPHSLISVDTRNKAQRRSKTT